MSAFLKSLLTAIAAAAVQVLLQHYAPQVPPAATTATVATGALLLRSPLVK